MMIVTEFNYRTSLVTSPRVHYLVLGIFFLWAHGLLGLPARS